MPITDVRHRHRDLGRIRAGNFDDGQVSAGETWRLTSPHRDLLEAASRIYGGIVDPFDRRDSDDRYQLTTTVDNLDVFIPPQDVRGGQWYELWTAAGLIRRCDGELIADGNDVTLDTAPYLGVRPDGTARLGCLCDTGRRDCKPVTHLHVILPNLPDVGVWRLTTRSIYAAAELPAQVELLLRGRDYAPAVLALEPRSTGKGRDRRPFTVPVLRTASTLLELAAGDTPTPAALTAPPPTEPAQSVPDPAPAPTNVPSPPPEASQEPRKPIPAPPVPQPLQDLAEHLATAPREVFGAANLKDWISDAFRLASDAHIWPDIPRRTIADDEPNIATGRPIDEWAARYLRPDPLDPKALDYAVVTFEDRTELVDEATLRAFATRVWMALRTELDRRKKGRR